MSFRDQVASMDDQLLDVLADEALIEGRDEPIPGFFSAPWLQPKVGHMTTSLRQPVFAVLPAQAKDILEGQILTVQLTEEDGGGRYVIAKREPDGTGWLNLVLRRNDERR